MGFITGADKRKAAVLAQLQQAFPKTIGLDFTGSSPPAVFVGKWNYPNIYAGILAPPQHDATSFRMNAPEHWVKENLSIEHVLALRGSMIYSRFETNTKQIKNRLKEVMQEIAMTSNPADVEFFLKKKPTLNIFYQKIDAPMANPAPLSYARVQSNLKIDKTVDSFVDDTYTKAANAMQELYQKKLSNTHLIQLLAAGLVGIKTQRKMVPSRWATTAVDSMLSGALLKNIREYPWLDHIEILEDEYCGNHFLIILLPREWSFEVMEINESQHDQFWQDVENYDHRTTYASSVTGAYYTGRLAVAEYLECKKKQASVIILREIKRSYWAHLGVGILRESCRRACAKRPFICNTLEEAYTELLKRMVIPLEKYTHRSFIIQKFRTQRRITEY